MEENEQNKHNINPSFLDSKGTKKQGLQTSEYFVDGILSGDKVILSKAITLVESKVPEHRLLASKILKKCLPKSGRSFRVGISGSPGVGKSTFIEALGLYAITQHKKPAILAIDPASSISGGSVLGDKTRMQELSNHNAAYIRPSSAGGELGGIQRNTKETIILCEAAGYDLILIETVGVGQAETKVHSMVDFFLLLILPGAGDELQGIKRGIVELADMIIVNKSDGDRKDLAKETMRSYKGALHIMRPKKDQWSTSVFAASSLEKTGIDVCWQEIEKYFKKFDPKVIGENRKKQDSNWFEEHTKSALLDRLFSNPKVLSIYADLLHKIESGTLNVFEAFDQFLSSISIRVK